MSKVTAKEPLISCAREIFLREAWETISTEKIRTKAGVSSGSLRHFFPGGKPDIAAGILADWHTEIWRGAMDQFGTSRPHVPDATVATARTSLATELERDHGRARSYFELEAVLLGLPAGEAMRKRRLQEARAIAQWAAALKKSPEAELLRSDLIALLFGQLLCCARSWAADATRPLPTSILPFLDPTPLNRGANSHARSKIKEPPGSLEGKLL